MISTRRSLLLAAPALLLPGKAFAQLASTGAGIRGTVIPAFLSSTVAATTTTFTNVAFGAADANRRIVLLIHIRNASGVINLTSVTIGGVTASVYFNFTSSTGQSMAIADAIVPTGTSGSIVIVTDINIADLIVGVHRLISFFPDNWSGISAGGSTNDTVYCDPAAGSFLVGGSIYFSSTSATTLSGNLTTTDYNQVDFNNEVDFAAGHANPVGASVDSGMTSTQSAGSQHQGLALMAYNPTSPAGTPGSLWTPANSYLPRGWFQGDLLAGSNGSTVSSWTDSTPFGNSAIAGTANPTLATANLNSLNAVRFTNASSQFLKLPANFGTKWGCGSYIFVAKSTSASGSVIGPPVYLGAGSSTTYYPYSDGHIYCDIGSNSRPDVGVPGSSAIASYSIFYISNDTLSTVARFNGSAFFTGTHESQFIVGSQVFLGHDGSTDYFDGWLAEAVILRGVPLLADIQRLEGYLAWKWGIQALLPGGHPYASAAPLN